VATIRQIAREAGVSVGTVSNVLNDYEHISDEVRQRVLEVVRRYNYRPSAVARSLSTRRTGMLGLIISLNPTPFYNDLAQGAIEAAQEAGIGLLVVAVRYEADDLLEQVGRLANQWVDGIFLATQPVPDEVLNRLPAQKTRLVVLDRGQAPPRQAVGVVGFDWQAAGYQATRHLLHLGHRRIGYVGGIPGRSSSQLREAGYLQALQEASLPADRGLMRDGDFFSESGYRQALDLLAGPDRPTALFAANDLMALGAYKAIAEMGLRIPAEVSVAGVDDVFFAPFLAPPLTTVRVPTKEAGREGVRILLDAAGEEGIRSVILPTTLQIRESTEKPHDPIHRVEPPHDPWQGALQAGGAAV
jgi:LacI family transcriptional regulator